MTPGITLTSVTRAEPAPRISPEPAAEPGFLSRPAPRRRVLDGMAAAVRERGYRESTVADVVRHARTSRRTFYEHFNSKQTCFIALLTERNTETIAAISAAIDVTAPWRTQVREAVEGWIAFQQADPALTLSWIRDIPALGEDARQLQRDTLDAFIAMIQTITATSGFESAGIRPPSRALSTILLGGFRELIATAVEDGHDISAIIDVSADSAIALLLGPR